MSGKCNQKTYTYEVSRGGTVMLSVSVDAESEREASSRLREIMESEGYEYPYTTSLTAIAEHRHCNED